jgi:dihydropteroate synthase
MQGTPATMQEQPFYADVVAELAGFFRGRVDAAAAAGIDPGGIALDPGIGFGKRMEDNLTLLARLSEFVGLGYPIVIGPSRKAFLGKLTDRPVSEREWGTAAAVAAAVLNGAHIVRVHSVKAMREVAAVSRAIRNAGAPHPVCPSLGNE